MYVFVTHPMSGPFEAGHVTISRGSDNALDLTHMCNVGMCGDLDHSVGKVQSNT